MTVSATHGSRVAPGKEFSISTGLSLILVVLLVLANGFFVATEFALVSVRRTRIQHLAAEGNRRAKSVLDRLNHLDTYIAATQLGITISSIGLGWIGEPAIARLLEPALENLPFVTIEPGSTASHTIAFIVAFSIVTALHIVIGELAPKSLALQRPEATSLFAAGPIHWFLIIFKPVIISLNAVGNWVVRLFGIEPADGHTLVQSAEELKLAIGASRAAGLVHQTAEEIVHRAFTFTDLKVRHVMVPRTEITGVPIDISFDELLRVASESSHMRLPVYEEDIDHVVGIVYVKGLLPLVYGERRSMVTANGSRDAGPGPATITAQSEQFFDVRDYMKEPVLVPETFPAAEVLTQLREKQTQIALVIDEYGGTAGIVTLEDLVESLVGEIQDELDPLAQEHIIGKDGTIVIDGMTAIFEARDEFGLDLDEDLYDVETVGGYVFNALGRPALVGDEVRVPSGEILRVEEIDGLRVSQVRVVPAVNSLVTAAS